MPINKEKFKKYLFCWDEIQKKDSIRFLKFLQSFGVEGTTPNIERVDNRTINISSGKNHLSISLKNQKTKATLKIDDFKTYEFNARKENGKIYIYPKPKVNDLLDKWILPLNKYHLKLWTHSIN